MDVHKDKFIVRHYHKRQIEVKGHKRKLKDYLRGNEPAYIFGVFAGSKKEYEYHRSYCGQIRRVQVSDSVLFLSLVAYYNRDQFTMQGVDSLQS